MSPLRSSAGPAVCTNGTSSSSAMIRARLVLPRPGRAGEQDVVERLAARGGGLDRDLELGLERVLADELVQPPRAQRLPRRRRRRGACGGLQAVEVGAGRADHSAAHLQRVGDQGLRRVTGGAVEQLLDLGRAEAEADQAVAGERARVVRWPSLVIDDRVVGDLRLELDDDPLRGALADAGHGLQARGVAGRDGGQQLARRAAGEHGERHLRADALDADQQQEQVALLLGREAVQGQRVLAHDQVREEGHGLDRCAGRGRASRPTR